MDPTPENPYRQKAHFVVVDDRYDSECVRYGGRTESAFGRFGWAFAFDKKLEMCARNVKPAR